MKAYYTDRLAAEWMADKFGMKFEIISSQAFHEDTSGEYIKLLPCGSSVKFYIHPDSMEILEPMEGDKSINGYIFTSGRWQRVTYPSRLAGEEQTAQRNNTAFMWPEFEGE